MQSYSKKKKAVVFCKLGLLFFYIEGTVSLKCSLEDLKILSHHPKKYCPLCLQVAGEEL